MSARKATPLASVDIEALVRVVRSMGAYDCDRAMRLALEALDIEPTGSRLPWSANQWRKRAAARVALRDALGIKD